MVEPRIILDSLLLGPKEGRKTGREGGREGGREEDEQRNKEIEEVWKKPSTSGFQTLP